MPYRWLFHVIRSRIRSLLESALVHVLFSPPYLTHEDESRLVDELRTRLRMSSAKLMDNRTIEPEWIRNVNRLTELFLSHDVRSFLSWDVIR